MIFLCKFRCQVIYCWLCKESTCNAGDLQLARDVGFIPWLGRFPGKGNGNLLQYSCLEYPRDGGAWWAAIHGVAQSWTLLK